MATFQHLVVLMLENRSFDNMLGLAFDDETRPTHTIPAGGPVFFGLAFDPTGTRIVQSDIEYWNPANESFFASPRVRPVKVGISAAPATDFTIPNPDPGEHFDRITDQIFGPSKYRKPIPANCNMLGFLLDYAQSAGSQGGAGIMHYYDPGQVPVITSLARNFAVCDRWFASSPTQTLPNRSFAHTGTSNGRVNNWPYDPLDFNVNTIFNVLETCGKSWAVYKDTSLRGLDRFCGTRVQFPHLWKVSDARFRHLDDFHEDARNGTLPSYSFLEPRLLVDGNDEHPPRDIRLGEKLIFDVYESIRNSGHAEDVLFLLTYDEHGGCYDHVPPPFGATPPDQVPGQFRFPFDRYGVRVPAILVSPFIEPGTVFRSDQKTADGREIPFDHTSILATLREWLNLDDPGPMLPSARVKVAPTFLDIPTRATPRTMPELSSPHSVSLPNRALDFAEKPNDLQLALAVGITRWADSLHDTRLAGDPTLVSKLNSRAALVSHVLSEIDRIKAKR